MKKNIFKFMLILGIGILSQFGAKAQWVREHPRHDEVEVRGARPSGRHFWHEGEWGWRGGAYVWLPGFWEIPPHGSIWVRGHWRNGPNGSRWVPGHWR